MTTRTTTRASRRRLSEAERAERRRQDLERLEQATKALLSSEGWQQWVRVRGRNGLARYSFGNQLLIATQCPDATFVAGFRAFLELNRCVRKGERAIRILAPMTLRNKQLRAVEDVEVDEDGRRVVFRTVFVFDVAQTDPLPGKTPVPLEAPGEPVSGDSHAHVSPRLEELAMELGFSVSYRPLNGGVEGWCDARRKLIVVNNGLPANGRVRVLVHELAHAAGIGYAEYGRERAEVLVDTVTYVVCTSIGLDTSGETVPYVAGWGESSDLDAIKQFAHLIDEMARRIEMALVD